MNIKDRRDKIAVAIQAAGHSIRAILKEKEEVEQFLPILQQKLAEGLQLELFFTAASLSSLSCLDLLKQLRQDGALLRYSIDEESDSLPSFWIIDRKSLLVYPRLETEEDYHQYFRDKAALLRKYEARFQHFLDKGMANFDLLPRPAEPIFQEETTPKEVIETAAAAPITGDPIIYYELYELSATGRKGTCLKEQFSDSGHYWIGQEQSVLLTWESYNVAQLFLNKKPVPLQGSHQFTISGLQAINLRGRNEYARTQVLITINAVLEMA